MDDLELYLNQFNGGLSSDEYLTPDGACFDMENVDINHSSMSITASGCSWGVINSRPEWRTIAVAPFGTEYVSYDWIIEDASAHGWNVYPWSSRRPCLFCMPQVWPKLLNSNWTSVIGHARNDELKGAVRGNVWSKPFWLVMGAKMFSLIDPDALRIPIEEDNQMSSLSDFILWEGWEITSSSVVSWQDCIKHTGWTGTITLVRPNQYWTYSTPWSHTITNYQMFYFGVNSHVKGSIRVSVSAPTAVFKWNTSTGKYDYQETETSTNTWDSITPNVERDWEFYAFAINGLDWNATWRITPTDDFEWEIFLWGLVNQENYLTEDWNNGDAMLSLDNCKVSSLWAVGLNMDTTDLQNRVVITERGGNYVAWSWNYLVILNSYISSNNFQVKPSLDMVLSTSYEIMWITIFGDQITIYANSNNKWYQMVWDWASIYPNYTYVWEWQTFETVISSMGYDYVTVRSARNTMQYYVVSWPNRNMIGSSDFFRSRIRGVDSGMTKEKARMLTVRDDQEIWGKLWIMRCWQPVFATLWGDLLVYGSKKSWFGNARYKPLSIGRVWTTSSPFAEVDCLWAISGGWIWIYYTSWKWSHCWRGVYKWYWNDDTFTPTNYFTRRFSYTLNPIIWSHFTEKEIDKFFVSYKLPNNKWKISLYAKVDDDTFWRFKPRDEEVNISKWDIYLIWQPSLYEENLETVEYMETVDGWLIFRRNWQMRREYSGTSYLTKMEWEWDEEIRFIEVDNWNKVWELRYNGYDHNYENLINSQVDSKLPFFHKIQFKIVCECVDGISWDVSYNVPPEIYNIYIPLKQHTVW